MPLLDCVTIFEAGAFGSDSGTVLLSSGEEPFPIHINVYALIFVVAYNSLNIPVVMA